ncbi:SET domain-containing protein [Phanerochaete sordida]|uniref:SET domain-containing protein n=1 Tax=Phanerochaete sordida TaxID=48140 RepID=A0A9P3GBK1_9APHY|nr:SET domain-containing protein [Phanerochaete sordida]
MDTNTPEGNAFIQWFKSKGATVDETAMGIADIPGYGRGIVAMRDLPKDHTLFTIPRDLVLSMRTSTLPQKFGQASWKKFGLHEGWTGLILCMLWEEAQGAASKWNGFFPILPTSFDTPMFWDAADVEELQGTAVVDKIGRDDAEKDFAAKLVPAIESRPDLFPPESRATTYTLARYHLMGSRILSRSFHVLRWKADGEEADEEAEVDEDDAGAALDGGAAPADGSAMDIDTPHGTDATADADEGPADDDDDDDDRYEDPADVAMVPMADMLNGRFNTETARLFYDDEHVLRMATVQEIKAGEQIWNTYGDPPNSDLLRRYGFVDVTTLAQPLSGAGNPADIVEIPANLVVEAAAKHTTADTQDRVDWWLEEAEDDVFVVGTDCELPPEMVSLARLLLQPKADWEKTRAKGKVPKPTMDATIAAIAVDVLQRRLQEYPTSIEEDEKLLADAAQLSLNRKMAVTVRLGEKRILAGALRELQGAYGKEASKRKRGADGSAGKGKKAKR